MSDARDEWAMSDAEVHRLGELATQALRERDELRRAIDALSSELATMRANAEALRLAVKGAHGLYEKVRRVRAVVDDPRMDLFALPHDIRVALAGEQG